MAARWAVRQSGGKAMTSSWRLIGTVGWAVISVWELGVARAAELAVMQNGWTMMARRWVEKRLASRPDQTL